VLLSQKSPCTEHDREALCISDLSFDEFLSALRDSGYKSESRAMRLAVEDPRQFWRETVQRGLDRAATIELTSTVADAGQRKGVLFALSAARSGRAETSTARGCASCSDPSTIPSVPLANGPEWAIWAAHARCPYRAALDVARGGLALSWIEPRSGSAPASRCSSTLQLVDIEFGQRTSSTFGLRPGAPPRVLTVNAGPSASPCTGTADRLGGEVGVSMLQDRLGVSVGVRRLSGFTTSRRPLGLGRERDALLAHSLGERKPVESPTPDVRHVSTKSSCWFSERASRRTSPR
jgi:hypothetical protein